MKLLINGFNQSSVVLLQFLLAVQFQYVSGLPLTWKTWKSQGSLKETSESQGIWDRIQKVKEKSENFVVLNSFSAKSRILFLKIFWGNMAPDPLNGLRLPLELDLHLEKSGESQQISNCLESGNPGVHIYI